MRVRNVLRAGVVVAVAAVAVLGFGGPASAHVTVNPNSATQGGYAKLTFRVPNEKANASTVGLEINLPTEAPIASVSIKPLAGWTARVERGKLPTPVKTDDGDEITEAVTKITWTADAGVAIAPGQFQEFEVSAGPLPEVDQVVFKALQTYSDNDVVRWIDLPGSNGQHPAPVLKLAKSTGDAHGDTVAAAQEEPAHDEDGGSGGLGVGLGVAGAVLGLAALVVALLAYRKATPTA